MQDKVLDLLEKKSVQMRGNIIASTIEVEMLIDDYLSAYFCKESQKANQLKELVLSSDRLSFGSKVDIVIVLVKSNKTFVSKYPDFVKNITGLLKHRNVFAHSEIKTDLENESNEITFVRYKGGKLQTEIYNDKTIKDIQISAVKICYRLISLIKEVNLVD